MPSQSKKGERPVAMLERIKIIEAKMLDSGVRIDRHYIKMDVTKILMRDDPALWRMCYQGHADEEAVTYEHIVAQIKLDDSLRTVQERAQG